MCVRERERERERDLMQLEDKTRFQSVNSVIKPPKKSLIIAPQPPPPLGT